MAINTDEGWINIRYCDGDYYVISDAFVNKEGDLDDMITGETIEVEITTETSSEAVGSNGTSSETTEASLEGNTSEETEGSTEQESSTSGSTDVTTTETPTRTQGSTKPVQPTTAAPKPTEAPKPTQAPTQTPKPTEAPKPTTAPTQAPKPTETPTQASPSCNHNWIPNYVAQTVTEQVWVVDQPAGDYPVYEWRTFCNGCGEDITENVDHVYGCEGSYHDDYIQVGTEYHDEVGHYETQTKTQYVANGSLCTICGTTK